MERINTDGKLYLRVGRTWYDFEGYVRVSPEVSERLDELLRERDRKREEEDKQRRQIAAEEQRRAELQARAPGIQRLCLERRITRLVHFSRVQNLSSILEKGLLSRDVLETWPREQQPPYNDSYRFDKQEGAVSLSISFPNYRMFYKYSMNDRSDWVILLLDATLLWELDCAFCRENAASSRVTSVPLADRKQPEALMSMFADYYEVRRHGLQLPDDYPTHPQAEVLVFDPIPPRYINEIHFYSQEVYRRWFHSDAGTYSGQFSFSWGKRYFDPRPDHEVWKLRAVRSIPTGYEEVEPFCGEELPW